MKKRVLYVEDNPHSRHLVKRIVVAAGYEMLEAEDGESGWVVAYRELPDLIFVDLLLPGIDGFELTRQIKSTPGLSHIPIATLTSYGNCETERLARAAGCVEFLRKPLDIQQIEAVLSRFLEN